MKNILAIALLTTLSANIVAGDSYDLAVKILDKNQEANNRMFEKHRHLLRSLESTFSLRSKSSICNDTKKRVSNLANEMNQLTEGTLKEIIEIKNKAQGADLTKVKGTQDLILLEDLANTLSGNLSVFTFSMDEEELTKFYQSCLTKAQEPMKESLNKISDRLEFQKELFINAKDQSLLKL